MVAGLEVRPTTGAWHETPVPPCHACFVILADPSADFNGSGGVDPDDLADFIGAFFG